MLGRLVLGRGLCAILQLNSSGKLSEKLVINASLNELERMITFCRVNRDRWSVLFVGMHAIETFILGSHAKKSCIETRLYMKETN